MRVIFSLQIRLLGSTITRLRTVAQLPGKFAGVMLEQFLDYREQVRFGTRCKALDPPTYHAQSCCFVYGVVSRAPFVYFRNSTQQEEQSKRKPCCHLLAALRKAPLGRAQDLGFCFDTTYRGQGCCRRWRSCCQGNEWEREWRAKRKSWPSFYTNFLIHWMYHTPQGKKVFLTTFGICPNQSAPSNVVPRCYRAFSVVNHGKKEKGKRGLIMHRHLTHFTLEKWKQDDLHFLRSLSQCPPCNDQAAMYRRFQQQQQQQHGMHNLISPLQFASFIINWTAHFSLFNASFSLSFFSSLSLQNTHRFKWWTVTTLNEKTHLASDHSMSFFLFSQIKFPRHLRVE